MKASSIHVCRRCTAYNSTVLHQIKIRTCNIRSSSDDLLHTVPKSSDSVHTMPKFVQWLVMKILGTIELGVHIVCTCTTHANNYYLLQLLVSYHIAQWWYPVLDYYIILCHHNYSNTHRQNHRHDLVALALVKATYSRKDSRTMDACKQQNHGSMQAAELWKHASSRTEACKQQNYESMQAAEPWKHASSRTMKAFKQQNHGLEYM